MKNKLLLKTLLLLILVSPKLCGGITQAQFHEYIKVSRGGQVLNYYQRKIVKEFSQIVEIKHRGQVRNKLREMLQDEEILEKLASFITLKNNFTLSVTKKEHSSPKPLQTM